MLMEKKNPMLSSLKENLLNEMEEIQILGGMSKDVHVYAIESCKPTFQFCGGSDCVAGCACSIEPQPDPDKG